MPTKHQLQALAVTIGALLLGAAAFSLLQARADRQALVRTLEFDLRRALESLASGTNLHGAPLVVSPQEIAGALSLKAGRGETLPSFVTPQRVYLPLESVPVPSGRLLCAVDLGGGHVFGMSTSGKFRIVPVSEMESWPHQTLSSAGAKTPSEIPPQR
jgi:hypothetical protein